MRYFKQLIDKKRRQIFALLTVKYFSFYESFNNDPIQSQKHIPEVQNSCLQIGMIKALCLCNGNKRRRLLTPSHRTSNPVKNV